MKARGVTFNQLVAAANAVERGVQNTYAKLFDFDDEPARKDDRLRAYLLALLIGKDPADYSLEITRPDLWPDDKALRSLLDARLREITSSYDGWVPDQALRAS